MVTMPMIHQRKPILFHDITRTPTDPNDRNIGLTSIGAGWAADGLLGAWRRRQWFGALRRAQSSLSVIE